MPNPSHPWIWRNKIKNLSLSRQNNTIMKKSYLLLLFLSFACACTRRPSFPDMNEERVHAIMQDVSERNRKYQPLTERDDTMMQCVIAYYKEHGTSNDLMEAYYLLGSVYRDLHDAPKAMEAFLNGIDAADTLDTDCRFDILARLYGQRCDILYKQRLYKNSAEEEKKVYKYATLAKDTVLILDSQWGRLGKCYAMCDYQTVADECMDVLKECERYGKYDYGARRLCTSVLANIELGRVEDAESLIEIYERYSGEVNVQTKESKFPIYYYAKGRLLTDLGKLDSAEWYFRMEMREDDWNNRQSAYRGLHEVFRREGRIDSAYRYAVLQCAAVDSAYQEMLSANLQNLHELYDYSRAQKDSYEKSLQLEEKQSRLQTMWMMTGILVLVAMFACYYFYSRYKRRIAAAALELERANARLGEQEYALALLKEQLKHTNDESEKEMLAEQVRLAEEETRRQEQEVQDRKGELKQLRSWVQSRAKEIRMQYQGCELFQEVKNKVGEGRLATNEDYKQIETLLLHDDTRLLVRFFKQVPEASEADRRTFLLLRFGMRKTEVSSLMAHDKTASAKACDRMFERSVGRRPASRAEAYNWLLDL